MHLLVMTSARSQVMRLVLTLPNAMEGLEFFLKPDFSKITVDVCLNALGQAFFSLSLGMGILVTYSAYFPQETHLVRTAAQVSGLDFLVADHDVRAALAERQGDAAAQAAGRAGHDRRSAIQTKLIHKFFLLNKPRRASRRRRTS